MIFWHPPWLIAALITVLAVFITGLVMIVRDRPSTSEPGVFLAVCGLGGIAVATRLVIEVHERGIGAPATLGLFEIGAFLGAHPCFTTVLILSSLTFLCSLFATSGPMKRSMYTYVGGFVGIAALIVCYFWGLSIGLLDFRAPQSLDTATPTALVVDTSWRGAPGV